MDKKVVIGIVLGLLALCGLTACLVFFGLAYIGSQVDDPEGTPVAEVEVTPRSVRTDNDDPAPQPTRVRPTATDEPIEEPFVEKDAELVFQFSFDDGDEFTWETYDEGGLFTEYDGGKYMVSQNTASGNYGLFMYYLDQYVGYSKVEADVEHIEGDGGSAFGVTCRLQDNSNFYMFILSSEGTYGIVRVSDGDLEFLTDENKNANINKYGSNHLEGICDGNRLTMKVNGVLVDSVEDTTDSLVMGDVGVIVTGVDEDSTFKVSFDNVAFSTNEQ